MVCNDEGFFISEEIKKIVKNNEGEKKRKKWEEKRVEWDDVDEIRKSWNIYFWFAKVLLDWVLFQVKGYKFKILKQIFKSF